MAREVIMPALGMAQSTGLIVAWRKEQGDSVVAGDVLMEVETDKATMEVEAAHDGLLAEIRHPAGAAVPVGDVIAVIAEPGEIAHATVAKARSSAPAQSASIRPNTAPNHAAAQSAAPDGNEKTLPVGSQDDRSKVGLTREADPLSKAGHMPEGGRIFASPKARRLAEQRCVDLKLLAARGMKQPLHSADIDRFVAVPKAVVSSAKAEQEFRAIVPADATYAFRRWVEETTGVAIDVGRIWALFAGVSLGRLRPGGDPLCVRISTIDSTGDLTVPERARLSSLSEASPETPADIVVLDLTRALITQAAIDSNEAPVLTLASGERAGTVAVTLRFTEAQLASRDALRLLDGFAGRIEDPLRHLL